MYANIYTPNATLECWWSWLNSGLYWGNFGIIWWVYKPHWLPSTKGSNYSLLDLLIDQFSHIDVVKSGLKNFGKQWELGMLTRLDNDTAGMVWFARDHIIKHQWIEDQTKGLITKIYRAATQWRIHTPLTINAIIQHHATDITRMIVLDTIKTKLGRSNIHSVSTAIVPIYISGNTTYIQACIHQWCRHQIRIHCNYHGTPIIGESLYRKPNNSNVLQLRSIGINRIKSWNIIIDHLLYK